MIGSSKPVAIVQQQRSDVVLSGLSWISIVSTDLRDRERQVDTQVQTHNINAICILEHPLGLQLGYCERSRLPMRMGRGSRVIPFALLVRRSFDTSRLVLVWRVAGLDGGKQYVVLVFEEHFLLMDRVVDEEAIEGVVAVYLENTESLQPGQLLTNCADRFPTFQDISDFDWMDGELEAYCLRPPRRARLLDTERRPVQAACIILGLVGISMLIAWYIWTAFVNRPKPVPPKPKPTAQELYLRSVTERIGAIGFDANTVRDLIIEMMALPISTAGWRLETIICNLSDCQLIWVGIPGADPRALDQWGQPDTSAKKPKVGKSNEKVQIIARAHGIKPTGVTAVSDLRSRIDAQLLCQREVVVLSQLSIRNSNSCMGTAWPEGGAKLPANVRVERYVLKVAADWVVVDRLLDRYTDGIYWREVRLVLKPDTNDLADLMQIELVGDVYGYR